MSAGLLIGIVLFPGVFVWFLFRYGHSGIARFLGIAWLAVNVIIAGGFAVGERARQDDAIQAKYAKMQSDEASQILPAANANAPSISQADYFRLRKGMSYEAVTGIIGSPGQLMLSSGRNGEMKQSYSWADMQARSITAEFENGKLSTWDERGL